MIFKRVMVTTIFLASMVGYAFAADDLPDSSQFFDVKEMPMNYSAGGGKLLLSDSPENVTQDGITYKDTVAGNVRLFFHHVNTTKVTKKIVVVLENNTDRVASVTTLQTGLGGPGYDFLEVGKDAQIDYMSSKDTYHFYIMPHDSEPLSNVMNIMNVKPNMLLNGIYDFYTDVPVTVKVMMMPVTADYKTFAAHAKVLPPDEYRLRGTFASKDLTLVPEKNYNPLTDGPKWITLADNEIDKYIRGIDATDGSEVLNYGNYGVVYKLFISSEQKGKFALYLSPQGGTYAGSVGIKYGRNELPPVSTPNERLYFGNGVFPEYAPLGVYNAGQNLWLKFSPPGASNLPVKILLMPEAK